MIFLLTVDLYRQICVSLRSFCVFGFRSANQIPWYAAMFIFMYQTIHRRIAPAGVRFKRMTLSAKLEVISSRHDSFFHRQECKMFQSEREARTRHTALDIDSDTHLRLATPGCARIYRTYCACRHTPKSLRNFRPSTSLKLYASLGLGT